MSRKVFLSFLGTSNYKETCYFPETELSNTTEPISFVQEASLKFHCNDFTEQDQIYVFCTDQAEKVNWNDFEHIEDTCTKTKRFKTGLKNRLQGKPGFNAQTLVTIEDGKSEREIWSTFKKIFSLLQEQDHVYFDITHSFRSIPMLNMVLISYAKLLKHIKVKGIYYGAYEAHQKVEEKTFTPIWNLMSYSILQDWTTAALLFVKSGDASALQPLLNQYGLGNTEAPNDFCKEITSSRLKSIISGESALQFKQYVEDVMNDEKDSAIPVQPILRTVQDKLNDYEHNSVLNGLHAAKWCAEHNLIQQGYTILSEFVITYALKKAALDHLNKVCRDAANSIFSIKEINFKYDEKDISKKHIQEEVVSKISSLPFYKEMCKRVQSINYQGRNDINHGGMVNNPLSPQELAENLIDKIGKLEALIRLIEKATNAP